MRECTIAVLFLTLSAGAAGAAISQANTVAPGGFAQAACYLSSSGGGFIAGSDLVASGSPADAEEAGFTGNSSASASAAASSGNINNNANAVYGMGYARLHAFNSCPNSTFFALGQTNGGWKESLTVSSPSLNGQAGYMVFQVRVRGTIACTGFAGAGSIITAGYKNNTELLMNSYFDRGPSDAISTDRQRTQWGLSSSGASVNRSFDGLVTMAVPITFGQSFTLGVYASARAGQRSSSGVAGLSSATVDTVGDGVSWAGITRIITSAGVDVGDAAVSSGSGVVWSGPYSSCGTADFNGDGDVGTDADIEAFFACLGGNCCPTCYAGGADFNGDGDVGTDADIESFFRVLGGGPC